MLKPVRVMERSVFSDRMVFVRAVRESGWMGDVELAVYDSWFNPILEQSPHLRPHGFIYLKCDPSTCMDRWESGCNRAAGVGCHEQCRPGGSGPGQLTPDFCQCC